MQIEAQSGLDTPFDRTLFAVPAVVPEWLPNSIARLFAKPFDAKRVVKDIAEERSRMPYAPVGTFPDLSPEVPSLADVILTAGAKTIKALASMAMPPATAERSDGTVNEAPPQLHDTSYESIFAASSSQDVPRPSGLPASGRPSRDDIPGAQLDGPDGPLWLDRSG